jgi:hypothetical protein
VKNEGRAADFFKSSCKKFEARDVIGAQQGKSASALHSGETSTTPNRILRLLADAVGEMERSPRSASQIANRLRHDLICIEKRARHDADMAKERQQRAEMHSMAALAPLSDELAGVIFDVIDRDRVVIRAHLAEALHAQPDRHRALHAGHAREAPSGSIQYRRPTWARSSAASRLTTAMSESSARNKHLSKPSWPPGRARTGF